MAFFNGVEIPGIKAQVVDGYSEEEMETARQESHDKGYSEGYNAGYENGYSSATQDVYPTAYNEGYSDGRASAEDEIQAAYWEGYEVGYGSGWAAGYESGYEDGYSNAVKEGTITITGASKTLSISGLPREPKELHLLGLTANTPEDERRFVGSLNFIKDGFSYGGTATIQAALWLRVKQDDNNVTGASNGSVAKAVADRNNIFTFENGIFTIDLSYHNSYTFGDNYTYKWVATF